MYCQAMTRTTKYYKIGTMWKQIQMKNSSDKMAQIFNHLISERQNALFTYTLRPKWQEGEAPYMGTGLGGGGFCSTSASFAKII
jgi:hypothetical protein